MAPARERERTSALSVARAAVPIYTYRARRRGILFLTTTTTTTANFSPRIGWRRALWSLSSLYASGDYRVDSVRRHDGPLAPTSRREGGSPFASALIYTRILHFFSFFRFLRLQDTAFPPGFTGRLRLSDIDDRLVDHQAPRRIPNVDQSLSNAGLKRTWLLEVRDSPGFRVISCEAAFRSFRS